MEEKVETKKKVSTAYTMVPGDNFMQYKVVAFKLENDKVVGQTQIGSADLKPVILGRLIKLLHRV